MNNVYITATGSYLPGDPIANDDMERYLGCIGGKPSRLRKRILRANGIRSRHYALDQDSCTTHLNEELAANAAAAVLDDRKARLGKLEMLAFGTTQGDVPVPGFASMVHGRLGGPPMEVLSTGGVCCSGMAALKSAQQAVACGSRNNAIAGGSELISRILKASRFEREGVADKEPSLRDFDADFLRWMLSDGAGAVMLEQAPHPSRPSLRIDWIDLVSHAGELPTCMYSGMRDKDEPRAGNTWLDHRSIADADRRGLMNLRQDTKLLQKIVAVGGEEYLRLVARGRFQPEQIDHVLCHYSSHYFRTKIFDFLEKSGLGIPEDRWFTNLYDKGNTGAASIFIMLDECMKSGRFKPGDQVLLIVPESGRFSISFAKLTCVAGENMPRRSPVRVQKTPPTASDGRVPPELGLVWADFERQLRRVPLVQRIESGSASLEDYQQLLLQLRQQVVDGARWIARAASNIDIEHAQWRESFIRHAAAEQNDYRMLEEDYVATGGSLEAIRSASKNIGSEALSAFIFNEASRPNPFALLGAMFVIEGLGANKALFWAEALSDQLGLSEEQTRFLRYHGENDDEHLGELHAAFASGLVDEAMAKDIVRVARVTARLYALQLEEVDHA